MQTTGQPAVSLFYFGSGSYSPLWKTQALQIQMTHRTKAAHFMTSQVANWCAADNQGTNSGGFLVKRPNMQSSGSKGAYRLLNSPNVIWCGTAATAHNIDQTFRRKFMQ
jgi:hypothetical protein